MSQTSTVSGLVARFALRRRATTTAFTEGVRLARLGAVSLDQLSPSEARAEVRDGQNVAVRLFATDGSLHGECTCPAGGQNSPCRHQVAVAHVVWVHDRRRN